MSGLGARSGRLVEGGTVRDTVVIVHGRHFKPRRGELLAICREALQHGLQRDHPDLAEPFRRLDVRLAYYGDLTNEFLRRRGENYDEELDVADRRRALGSLQAMTKSKQFKMTRYDRLPGKSALREFAADVSSGLLGVTGLADRAIARLAPDLAEYWQPAEDYAEAVRQRVADAVDEGLANSRRVMVISHGTGSIVSWDVFWQMSHKVPRDAEETPGKIDTWVTLGSPLGDESVKKRLFGGRETGRLRYPANILAWQNVAAEDDYLCHDKDLANDFRAMMDERLVSSITDNRIYNLAVRYGKSNPHSSVGYLIHPRVSQILADWLQY